MKLTGAYWFDYRGSTGLNLKVNEKWHSIESPISPYFFIPAEKQSVAREMNLQYEKGDYVTPEGKPCLKIICKLPNEVKRVRDAIQKRDIPTYEADLPFVNRFCIDKKIEWSPCPRILWYDIEVSSEKEFPRPQNPIQRILSIAAVDNKTGREFFFCDDDENWILSSFAETIKNYDLVVGFFSSEFDEPYLRGRTKLLNFRFPFKEIEWADFAIWYGKIKQYQRVPSLDTIAKEEVGFKMTKPLARGKQINEWFKKDRKALMEYNLDDCLALKKINDTLGTVETFTELASIGHIPYSSTLRMSRIVDAFILKEAQKETPRIVFPTKGPSGRSYEGAYVLDTVPGYHKNVKEIDYRGLYPSIIRSFNIGIETIGGEIQSEKLSFKKTPRSIFARILDELAKQREEYKKMAKETEDENLKKRYTTREQGLKVVSNTFYGVIGREGSRYFNPDLAESITLTGQALIKAMADAVKKRNRLPVAGDTDSVLYKGDDIPLDELNEEIKKFVLSKYNVPSEYYCITAELKYVYEWCYLTSKKKRRVGDIIYPERKRIVKGFELKKHNTPPIVSRVQEMIFEKIRTPDEAMRFLLNDVYNMLMKGYLDDELVIQSGTKMNLNEYKSTNAPQVKALKKALEIGAIRPGEPVRYVISDVTTNGLEVDVVIPGEPFPKITKTARQHYWENRILPVVESILEKKIYYLEPNQRRLTDYV